jgi:hypothetical protein
VEKHPKKNVYDVQNFIEKKKERERKNRKRKK